MSDKAIPLSEEHQHDWMTKYSTRMGVDGVEWFCHGCKENLSWPEVRRRVNITKELEEKIEAIKEEIAVIREHLGDSWVPTPTELDIMERAEFGGTHE